MISTLNQFFYGTLKSTDRGSSERNDYFGKAHWQFPKGLEQGLLPVKKHLRMTEVARLLTVGRVAGPFGVTKLPP